ncbi:MAG: hypothetical protein LBF58_02090, partial [Deltaproteobacteria bacterium]|nr:hypothetical protein [Deltaproteobacteria bacterium]
MKLNSDILNKYLELNKSGWEEFIDQIVNRANTIAAHLTINEFEQLYGILYEQQQTNNSDCLSEL